MPISEQQLATWTNPPSATKLAYTYDQVKKAIAASPILASKSLDVYLQGSYANSTHIKGDSDIDIVVQLNDTYTHDTSLLSPVEKQTFQREFTAANYQWPQFREDVRLALDSYFGNTVVRSGTKSIKLLANDYRLNADIVPALVHHNFTTYPTWNQAYSYKGIKFWTIPGNQEIINYPKLHITNAEDKILIQELQAITNMLSEYLNISSEYYLKPAQLTPKLRPHIL